MRWQYILRILFLTGLVLALYMPTGRYAFISDDIDGIVRMMPVYNWQSIAADPYRFFFHLTRPVQLLIYTVFGLDPLAYRLVNIIFHTLAVILVYACVCRLMGRQVGFLAASLFAVHPLLVESVTWISGGVYVQYGMLFLLSFWLYIRDGKDRKRTWLTRHAGLLGSYGIYILCLLSSEKACVLVLLFVSYEWCFRNLKLYWKRLIPYGIASSIVILFHIFQVSGRVAEVARVGGGDGGWYNPLVQLPVAVTAYIERILWPNTLSFYFMEPALTPVSYSIQLMVLVLGVSALVVSAWKKRIICFWLLWFIIPLLPTLTPFNVAWIMAERYAYLSSIGIFVCISYYFDRAFRFISWNRYPLIRWVYWLVWGGIIIALFYRSHIRNQDWQNQDSLWIATARTAPLIPYTWNNMGDVYSRRGDLEGAAKMFQRAIALNPRYADAYHNLAETYWQMGEMGDAILMYEQALVYNSRLWQSHQSLAIVYYYKKDYQKALFHIEKALEIVPDNQTLLQARDELLLIQ